MKAKLKFVAVCLLSIMMISACSNNNQQGTVTPTPSQGNNEQIILIWWNLFEPEENVRPLIEAYQDLHPNVTIQYEQKGISGGVDEYRAELDRVLNDGNPLTTPDIFTIHNSWVGRYEGYISKAPQSLINENSYSEFFPIVKNDFYRNGAVALPLYLDALAIIYNKDKLIASGYTVPSDDWSEFQLQAANLTQRSGGKVSSGGFSAYTPENTEFYFDLLSLLMLQNGVTMVDASNTQAIFANQAETQDALDFYSSFIQGANATWDDGMKKDIAAFLEGDLAMYAAPSWRLIDIINYNEQYNLNLDFGVVPVPQLGGDSDVHWPTYWGQTVSKDTREAQVAWDFIKFITEAERLEMLDNTVKQNGRPIGIIFPRRTMADDIASDAYLGPYVQSLINAQDWYMYDGYQVSEHFADFLNGESDLAGLQSRITLVLSGE